MHKLFLVITLALGLATSAHSQFYQQRASLFAELPVDSTSIVFLGNSITNGCEWHELLGMPNALNRGISGDIVQGIEDRLDPIVNGHPAKIFLMIGVNDVGHDLSADSIATATIALIDHIRRESPSTQLYVQSILPINIKYGRYKNLEGKDQVIRDVNAIVEPAAIERGATWINLYPSFADQDGHLRDDLTNDGLHLIGSAYVLWGQLLQPYLAN